MRAGATSVGWNFSVVEVIACGWRGGGIGSGGGSFGSGTEMIDVGGSKTLGGSAILALITTAIRTMCPQMTNSIALGLDWRAPMRGRPAAYASISILLSR